MKVLKLVLVFFVFTLFGCQSLSSLFQDPKISLNSVDITGISLEGVSFIARIDVENTNSFSIPLPKVDWELFINSSSFINGVLKENQTIRGRNRVTVEVPFGVTFEGLYKSFKSVFETKEVAFDIALGVTFPIPIIEARVFKFDFSGSFPIPELPRLSYASTTIGKIDFSGVDLCFGINVENPNKFPIPFPQINWDYSLNDVSVLKSNFTMGAKEIAAGAAGLALVSLSVSYADVFKAVNSLRTSGEANSTMSLSINSAEFLSFNTAAPASGSSALPAAGDDNKGALKIPGKLPILHIPELSFQGITTKSKTLISMEFALNWEIDNQNIFDFTVGEFNYDFKVNNRGWASGRIINPPVIRANGKTVIPLTITITALDIIRELVDIIAKGTTVNYSCTGNMSLLGSLPGLGKIEQPLNLQGSTRIR